jgi:hypothetical protein
MIYVYTVGLDDRLAVNQSELLRLKAFELVYFSTDGADKHTVEILFRSPFSKAVLERFLNETRER